MKLELNIDGRIKGVDFNAANGEVQMSLDGTIHSARVSEPEPGLFTVIINDHVYRCVPDRMAGGAAEIIVNGRRIPLSVRDPRSRRTGTAGAAESSGRVTLTAPMPGKIVRVLKAAGDEVAAEQGILIVEAMKMQNEVLSPRNGRLVEIRVTEGQTVNAGETLAIIE
jgi:biotin carboxyl carrier protein